MADEMTVECMVKNTGDTDGYEKVQLYAEPVAPECRVPKYELRGCAAVYLKAGEETKVSFTVTREMLRLVDENGERFDTAGGFRLYIGGGQPDERTLELTGARPAVFKVK